VSAGGCGCLICHILCRCANNARAVKRSCRFALHLILGDAFFSFLIVTVFSYLLFHYGAVCTLRICIDWLVSHCNEPLFALQGNQYRRRAVIKQPSINICQWLGGD